MKKILLAAVLCLIFTGCSKQETQLKYEKFDQQFFDVFDTVSSVSVYAQDREQADEYLNAVHERLLYLHEQFDPYNNYDGVVNLKTLNDAAGKEKVTVTEDLYFLLEKGRESYELTNGKVNIAMGCTLELWHKYRDDALDNGNVAVPSAEELEATRPFNDISALELDKDSMTVYISKDGVSVNLGAFAKGYAASEALEVLHEKGCDSALVNLGGNVACFKGTAKDEPWKVGVQDPQDPDGLLDVVEIENGHLVSSGDYQRFYVYDGKKIHHIIDPDTLMPADGHIGTTVIMSGADQGIYADMLSTAAFIMSDEESRVLADKFNVKQLYSITPDGECKKIY